MNISSEGIAITNRFFEAIAMLKAQKRIRGLGTFTRAYGISRWNMNTLKAAPHAHVLKAEWIAYLAKDYGVSCRWLILGEGGMFDD